MKIAVFYNLSFGGAKRVVQEHVKGLVKLGHTVDLYTTDSNSDIFDPSLFASSTFKYSLDNRIKFKILGRLYNDYENFILLKNLHHRIAQDINKKKYDVVLVHPDHLTQAPFLLRFLKRPNAYYCQEPLRIAYEYSLKFTENVGAVKKMYELTTRNIRKKIDQENTRSATITIASCFHVRERMISAYNVFPKVIYCGVDDKIFRPKNIPKKNQVFFVGSKNVSIDGYDLAEGAIKFIPAKIRPKLHVVSWKKSNGERLSEEELVTIYNESIATISSSRFETFGLVPLESMACGIPVIATNVSGHRETVLDGKTGFLVDFDPKEFAKKIEYIIKNKSEAERVGKAGRAHVEKNLSWKVIIPELEKCLQVLAKKT